MTGTGRVSISLLEKLFNQLQFYKNRMNVSLICQKAIKAAMEEVDRLDAEEHELIKTLKAMLEEGRIKEVIQEMDDFGFREKEIMEFLRTNGEPKRKPKRRRP